ncbi:MAG: glycosyltransferase family 4 protein [Alkalinema sp. RU_4_3]|nr:glycosyltransferase family 4 protein [Alkalinema sp. RU_4_3]
MLPNLRYALVHEWLTPKATGGSELVVQDILQFIEADLYALIDFESRNPKSYLYGRKIGHSFMQHFPGAESGVQKYLPFLPLAIEQIDLRAYDVILSSSHCVAKGVMTTADQLHLCYCHAPMRYAWDMTFEYLGGRSGRGLPGLLTRYLLHRLRYWDSLSAHRVDHFIANSQTTARRIWRAYRRRAEVIYPPVETDRFPFQADKADFYLTVARLVGYKKIPLIVQAFNQLKLPLVVIGSGPELALVKQLAGPNIKVLGWQSDGIVAQYMGQARAFVYAAYEDFGIAPVEAQACGTPVIAYASGGTLETVRDLRQWGAEATGLLFPQQSVQALVSAIETFEKHYPELQPQVIRDHALSFDRTVFQTRYQTAIERAYATWQTQGQIGDLQIQP